MGDRLARPGRDRLCCLAFIWPEITLTALILLFGAYAMVDGVMAAYTGIRWSGGRRWPLLLEGRVGIGAGLVTFFYAVVFGITLLMLGWRLRALADRTQAVAESSQATPA